MSPVTSRASDAFGWATDSLAEHWHINKTLSEAIAELVADADSVLGFAPAGDSAPVGWVCRAHKLRIEDMMTDAMVESMMEHLDEIAGENFGLENSLYRNGAAGSGWYRRTKETREAITPLLQEIWSDTLWYHEVADTADVRVRFDTKPKDGEWVRFPDEEHWYKVSFMEGGFVHLATDGEWKDRVFRPGGYDDKRKVWVATVGEWRRFGARRS